MLESFCRSVPLVAFVFCSCATSPLGRKQLKFLPDSQMNAMGAQSFQAMKTSEKIDNDPATKTYIDCIVTALARSLPANGSAPKNWETQVFLDETPNAFALPGGYIGMHTGMLKLANQPAELAAVLGHEIGHVLAGHGNERMSQSLAVNVGITAAEVAAEAKGINPQITAATLGVGSQLGIILPFSRIHESEADQIGQDLMAKAGFDPAAAIEL